MGSADNRPDTGASSRIFGRRYVAVFVAAAVAVLVAVLGHAGVLSAAAQGSSTDSPEGSGGGDGLSRTMLVLDSSGSMAESASGGQTKIGAAKSALRTVVRGLPERAQVGLRVFGARVFSGDDPGACRDSQRVVEPGTDNRGALLEAVGKYKPYGETPIPYALRQAAKDLGEEGSRSIVLVSDGESTCDPDPCEVAREIGEDGINVRIDVVGLSVSGRARRQLQCVAQKGNGSYYDAEGAEEIVSTLDRAATRALRPFTLTGTRIEGGPVESPAEVSVGDWVDTVGPVGSETESKSYRVEKTAEGSTLRVAGFTQGAPGVDDGLDVEIYDSAGESCASSRAIRQIDTRRVVGVQVNLTEEEGCQEAGSYRITVSRRLADEKTVPFGLRVAEEPPLTDSGSTAGGDETDVTTPEVSGEARSVEGGASFANASEIGEGRWSSTLVPGEALMYRLPLEFGQAARVRVHFPAATAAMRKQIGRDTPLSQLVLYDPMRGQLELPSESEYSGSVGDEEAQNLVTATPTVSRGRIEASGFNGIEDYSMTGSYYVGVSVAQKDYSVEIPFTIEVEILGEPAQGPTYAEGMTWSVAEGIGGADSGGDGDAADQDSQSSPADGAGDASAPPGGEADGLSGLQLTAGVGSGLLGVAAVVAGLLLWRRRRTGSS